MSIDALCGQQEQNSEQRDRREVHPEVSSLVGTLSRPNDLFFRQKFCRRGRLEAWEWYLCWEYHSHVWRQWERISVSDGKMVSKDLYALVRANTVRVKIDDQCDILVTVSDSMAERDHPTWGEGFLLWRPTSANLRGSRAVEWETGDYQ